MPAIHIFEITTETLYGDFECRSQFRFLSIKIRYRVQSFRLKQSNFVQKQTRAE